MAYNVTHPFNSTFHGYDDDNLPALEGSQEQYSKNQYSAKNYNNNNNNNNYSYYENSYSGEGKSAYRNNSQNRTARTIPEIDKFDFITQLTNILIVGLLFGVLGAASAWALTSIAPLSGALMTATFAASFISGAELAKLATKDEDLRLAGGCLAAVIATNLVVYGAFPYLGLAEVSLRTATFFSTATCIGGTLLLSNF